MNVRSRPARERAGASGFTLLEVLVSLALAGLVVAMLSQVLGQSLTNNRVLQASLSGTSQLSTLRRILHRDLQNITVGTKWRISSDELSLETSNNFLVNGPLPMTVSWRVRGGVISRTESNVNLGYESTTELLALTGPSKIEFLDSRLKTWVDLSSWIMAPDRPMPLAMRMTLNVDGGEYAIVERIPGDLTNPTS